MYSKTKIAMATSVVMVGLLSGCANTAADYEPLVDGPKDNRFYEDLAACKALAEQREYLNGDTKSEALLGAGLGALAGALDGGGSDIVGGAIVGGAAGAGGRAWDTREERKGIVIQCMAGRGHKIVG